LTGILNRYEKHLRSERGLATATIINYLPPFARKFLVGRFGEGPFLYEKCGHLTSPLCLAARSEYELPKGTADDNSIPLFLPFPFSKRGTASRFGPFSTRGGRLALIHRTEVPDS
jgi:hypothetical protein